MKVFKDQTGQEWEIKITGEIAIRMQELHGFDIADPPPVSTLMQMLWQCCQKPGLTRQQFFEQIDEQIGQATALMFAEWHDFSQRFGELFTESLPQDLRKHFGSPTPSASSPATSAENAGSTPLPNS